MIWDNGECTNESYFYQFTHSNIILKNKFPLHIVKEREIFFALRHYKIKNGSLNLCHFKTKYKDLVTSYINYMHSTHVELTSI